MTTKKRMRVVANPQDPRAEARKVVPAQHVARLESSGARWVFGRMDPWASRVLNKQVGRPGALALKRAGISILPPRSKNASGEEIAAAAHAYTSAEDDRLNAIRSGSRQGAKAATKRSKAAMKDLQRTAASGPTVGAAVGAALGAAAGAMGGPLLAAAGGVAGALAGSMVVTPKNGRAQEPPPSNLETEETSLAPYRGRYRNLAKSLKE
jgi:hypothetical protein